MEEPQPKAAPDPDRFHRMRGPGDWRSKLARGSSWEHQFKTNIRAMLFVCVASLGCVGFGLQRASEELAANKPPFVGGGVAVVGVMLVVSYALYVNPNRLAQGRWVVPGSLFWLGVLVRHFWVLALILASVLSATGDRP